LTKEEASKMAFCIAKSSPVDVGGKQMFKFNRIEGGKFAVGDNCGTISSTHFCFLSVAGCGLNKKCYVVLYSSTMDSHLAAVAVSVDEPVYAENFRSTVTQTFHNIVKQTFCNIVTRNWNLPVLHRSVLSVTFKDEATPERSVDPVCAEVKYPETLNGWTVNPNDCTCKILKEHVDYPGSLIELKDDYPPRILFEMKPSEDAAPCNCDFELCGMNREIHLRFNLKCTQKPMWWKKNALVLTAFMMFLVAMYIGPAALANSWTSIFHGDRSSEPVTCTTQSTSPQNQAPKWLNVEPQMKLLHLIKYKDSEGNDKKFRLISVIQNNCRHLGTLLGIEEAQLDSFDSLKPDVQCREILDLWITRGEGDYPVTWAGLLEAMEDAELGGIANSLREALTLAEVQ
jgi:hypothetical protein